jgi:hypothetical protein
LISHHRLVVTRYHEYARVVVGYIPINARVVGYIPKTTLISKPQICYSVVRYRLHTKNHSNLKYHQYARVVGCITKTTLIKIPKTTLISNPKNIIWHGSWLHKKEDILIESETEKLLLHEALFTTTMSKARVPRRKEEYVPPDEIKEFRKDILEAGRHLAVVNSPRFPDAERVSKAIGKVLTVVNDYKRLGMWVTSRVRNTEYATTKEICEVSLCMFSLSINAMHNF